MHNLPANAPKEVLPPPNHLQHWTVYIFCNPTILLKNTLDIFMAKHLPKTFDEIDKSCQKLNLRLFVQPPSPLLASKLQGSNKKKFKNIMKHNQQLLKLQIKKKTLQ